MRITKTETLRTQSLTRASDAHEDAVVWAPVDFGTEIYEQKQTEDRVAAIRAGVNGSSMFMGPVPAGRPLAEQVCENYRMLRRRIDELEADITDLLDDERETIEVP